MNRRSNETTKVKICGIRDLEIARICREEGADYIGLNFVSSSPRKIDLAGAHRIVDLYRSQKNSPKIVLLFYKNSHEEMETVISALDHDYIQWVWDDATVTPNVRETLFRKRQICSYRVSAPITNENLRSVVPGELLILDSYSKGAGGGTGERFNWEYVQGIERNYLLAGGLTPSNVAQAVRSVRPFGVDVASGVESSPGTKDAQKVIQFIRNAKSAL
ncbi:phosphoribosylanthranilate isomerase [Leptospira sp. FAT2]|uniref:phosphoribosylanthranilate isomerase n=1 Tax=Leptospira sanjuanensis TaxID=2879643 RepID=UPI001EE8137A|nr:phosphoribosylanthranilate isomerase [Leptospira sanjuanensis]MCG6193336.1 phosphoribosylanthranilate isomerase [Leptospira sanjuanensis]